MSNKICPSCQTQNASMNLSCIKCGESLIHINPVIDEEYENRKFGQSYFWEEFFTDGLVVRLILGIFFAFIGIARFSAFFFALSILVVGTAFMPKENDWFSPTFLLSVLMKKYKK